MIYRILSVVGAGAIVSSVIKKGGEKVADNITVSVGTPIIDKSLFTNGSINLKLPISIENKNIIPIGVSSFSGVVSYGAVTLSNVSLPTGFYINPNDSDTITLNIAIPIQKVLNDLSNVVSSGNLFNALLNKIYLNGSINMKYNGVNLSIPIESVEIPII